MDALSDFLSGTMFWRILLFLHFLIGVALLAAVTLQSVTVLVPARQTASGNFVDRLHPVSPDSLVKTVVWLYVPNFLLGAFVYTKYRTYVRIPMEQLQYWWTLGGFEFKEHIITMGIALLPAYWYFWRQPLSQEHTAIRKWVTVFVAVAVWYSFLSGHVANNFRGVGS
jgi:hypothetical protein